MGTREARLELRFIAEKLRNRFSVQDKLEGSAWSPKVLDLPPGRRFLVLSPHPDDDVVGCGGTIMKLLASGAKVRVVYLSIQDGDFTRDARKDEIARALGRMGVDDHHLREDTFPTLREATDLISDEIRSYQPDGVFVPSPFENHNEHLRTFEAFMSAVATNRDGPDALMYEVWGALMPNLLVPVDQVMQRKVVAILEHWTQVREIDYVKAVQGMNGYRAATMGLEGWAEAFLAMPSTDLIRHFS